MDIKNIMAMKVSCARITEPFYLAIFNRHYILIRSSYYPPVWYKK